jgi:hypothetical protein
MDLRRTILLLNTILDTNYFTLGLAVFKQICGVPMGGRASSIIANYFLWYCELDAFTSLYNDYPLLSRTYFRFVDDILILGALASAVLAAMLAPYFERHGITLTLSSTSSHDAPYLELRILVDELEWTISFRPYSKKDFFTFFVPLLPDITNNCLCRFHYINTIRSRFLIFSRLSSHREYLFAARQLARHLILHRRYPREWIDIALRRVYTMHPEFRNRFANDEFHVLRNYITSESIQGN